MKVKYPTITQGNDVGSFLTHTVSVSNGEAIFTIMSPDKTTN